MTRKPHLTLAVLLAAFSCALAASARPAAASAPSCAEGPRVEGETIVGTPCDDTIHVPRGVTTVHGEGGDDTIYGGRGNQSLYGGPGNDRLYGGIGDDRLRGGPGDDLLSGGFGADSLDGEEGSDYARGDATIDYLGDTGSGGGDTLSFVTGATPGFPNAGDLGYQGFPEGAAGRGVFVKLGEDFANDGLAPAGGGVDAPLPPAEDFEGFETVIGTPFSDYIVGGAGTKAIYGGGGADVILGGGAEHVVGGAGGDYCEGAGTESCEFGGSEKEVAVPDPSQVDVGLTAPAPAPPALYVGGSDGTDRVSATFESSSLTVTFRLLAGSTATFDAAEVAAGECALPEPSKAVCTVAATPDTIVLAGLEGDDSFSANGFPDSTSIVELGGEGDDELSGTEAEDVLVDGTGNDEASAAGGDDALPNNAGADNLSAGPGNDLFISDAICEGDTLNGGAGRDNANWANFDLPVSIDLASSSAGLLGAGGLPDCAGDPETALHEVEDIEATNLDDSLIGDEGENQLLGRRGSDSYHAEAGNDTILANSGDSDAAIDCGEGFDTAEIDIPTSEYADPTPIDCEAVFERPPNSFRPPQTPPGPEPEPEPTPQTPPVAAPPAHLADVIPPRTRILHRPRRTVFSRARRRTVAFAFAANESGSRFRCRLDRGRFRPCRSPRRYRVGPGRHTFRVFAIDAAGNRDRTPAVFHFRVRRLSDRSSRSRRRRGRTRSAPRPRPARRQRPGR
jgi:Ca2+-binding RTX toxin-like protein